MKIVNNTQVDNPNQWIESFVEEVLDNAKIDCEQILIEKIEEEKHIFLDVDGEKYDIRLWAFLPIAADLNGMVCRENVQYMLYRKKNESDKEYTEQVDDDFIRIERGNRAAYEVPQEKTLF
ncbi:MAG: hypothetical protein ACLUZ0_12690 [Coprococcus sp.]